MCAAQDRGGMEHIGWDHESYALAGIYDAINLNTLATGNWKKGKEPKLPPFYRPKLKKAAKAVKQVARSGKDSLERLYRMYAKGG